VVVTAATGKQGSKHTGRSEGDDGSEPSTLTPPADTAIFPDLVTDEWVSEN
jgi:hypothetical protein